MNKKIKLFKRRVNDFFDFLVHEYGFEKMDRDKDILSYGTGVRYIHENLFIDITFIFRGSSIEVSFGRLSKKGVDEENYSYHMLLGILNHTEYYKFGASIANSKGDLLELLEMYSKSLRKDGLKILKNDVSIFNKMKEAENNGSGLCPPYYDQNKIISKFI